MKNKLLHSSIAATLATHSAAKEEVTHLGDSAEVVPVNVTAKENDSCKEAIEQTVEAYESELLKGQRVQERAVAREKLREEVISSAAAVMRAWEDYQSFRSETEDETGVDALEELDLDAIEAKREEWALKKPV